MIIKCECALWRDLIEVDRQEVLKTVKKTQILKRKYAEYGEK